jgi:hypothetical protein
VAGDTSKGQRVLINTPNAMVNVKNANRVAD